MQKKEETLFALTSPQEKNITKIITEYDFSTEQANCIVQGLQKFKKTASLIAFSEHQLELLTKRTCDKVRKRLLNEWQKPVVSVVDYFLCVFKSEMYILVNRLQKHEAKQQQEVSPQPKRIQSSTKWLRNSLTETTTTEAVTVYSKHKKLNWLIK